MDHSDAPRQDEPISSDQVKKHRRSPKERRAGAETAKGTIPKTSKPRSKPAPTAPAVTVSPPEREAPAPPIPAVAAAPPEQETPVPSAPAAVRRVPLHAAGLALALLSVIFATATALASMPWAEVMERTPIFDRGVVAAAPAAPDSLRVPQPKTPKPQAADIREARQVRIINIPAENGASCRDKVWPYFDRRCGAEDSKPAGHTPLP